MTIGVPFALLPEDAHDFAVTYTGSQFMLFADGVLLDVDFSIDIKVHQSGYVPV